MAESIRVLHVDDEPDFADLAATFLEREDDRLDVATARSASDGLDHLADAEVDCIVSDYDMPGLNGIEFLETVRKADPDLPFILFTGKGTEEVASDAISAGVTDYLQKEGDSSQYTVLANRIANAVEQYRSQQALSEQTRQLETLIRNLPGIVYRCTNERGWPMENVGGEIEHLTGYTADALEADVNWGEEIVHPEDRETVWETVQDALAREEPFEVTYRIVTRDGTTKWVREQGRGVYTADDELEALEGFITGIDARNEYEHKRREQALKALHDVATDITTLSDPEAICRRTVEAAESVLDFDKCILYLEEGGQLPVVAVSEEFPGGGVDVMPIEGSRAGKTYRTGEAVVFPDISEDPVGKPQESYESGMSLPIGDHGVMQAVSRTLDAFDEADLELGELLAAHTEQALGRTEQETTLRRQNERLEEFTRVVSHDLRNPVNVAEGHLELAQQESDSDHLDDVSEALDRMNDLIVDLLALAREGDEVSGLESVDLADSSDACWRTVATADATIVTDIDRTVRADRSRLRQLLENLYRNAVEHGGAEVTVTVGETAGGFYVEDDGPGIPPGEHDEVFDAGYSTVADGTGFGLSIVEQVATAHGWDVQVLGGTDGGARFEITGVEFD